MFYLICCGLFATSIVLQVFYVGAALLVDGRYLETHRALGHIVIVYAFAMLLVGVVARLPWRMHVLNVVLVLLFMAQYVFLWVVPQLGVPLLRALHAVNALVLFWIASYLAQRAWRLMRTTQRDRALA